jgi:hypothetical protein
LVTGRWGAPGGAQHGAPSLGRCPSAGCNGRAPAPRDQAADGTTAGTSVVISRVVSRSGERRGASSSGAERDYPAGVPRGPRTDAVTSPARRRARSSLVRGSDLIYRRRPAHWGPHPLCSLRPSQRRCVSGDDGYYHYSLPQGGSARSRNNAPRVRPSAAAFSTHLQPITP